MLGRLIEMQKHAFLTLVGLILAALCVAWLRPNASEGTAFVVVTAILFVNVVGAMFTLPNNAKNEPHTHIASQEKSQTSRVSENYGDDDG